MTYLSTEEQQVLYLIKTDPDQFRYFFAKAKNLKWFYPLKDAGYFDPKTIRIDEKGTYFWPVLDYLEQVSKQVEEKKEYGKELIDIIESLVRHSLTERNINHYHIWWFCVKILNNLPAVVINEFLPLDDYQTNGVNRYGFRSWLLAWTKTSSSDLTISDISENLLHKFLSDQTTVKYAEAIIDSITSIKAGPQAHAFTEREDALLVWDRYWILQAFKKNATLIADKCSLQTILRIADKLNKALEYKQKSHYVNFDLANDVYQIDVHRISPANISKDEIKFETNKYQCFVRKFNPEQLKNMDRKKDFWALHKVKPEFELTKFVFEPKNNEEFQAKVIENLPANVDWKKADEFNKKIGFLFPGLHEDYSSIWFKSVESGGSEHASGTEEILSIILRDTLLEKCKVDPAEAKQILERLLSSEYKFPIFKRITLLCIDKFWANYSDLFPVFLKMALPERIESDYEVEFSDLLRNHYSDLEPDVVSKLKQLIENIPEYYIKEGLTAYWQYKWLSPLRDHPDFSDSYKKAKDTLKPKDDKPYKPERAARRGGFVTHKSPISQDEILKKPIAELIKYLNDFQGADYWRGTFEGEPDKEGLANTLEAAAKENPEKFINEIEKLHTAPYKYLHRILWGIQQAIGQKKQINLEKVLDFAISYIGSDPNEFLKKAFDAQANDSGKGRYVWVIEDVVGIIDRISGDDEKEFHPDIFKKAEKLFDLIFPLLKGEKYPEHERDALTYVINTTLGKTIESFLAFSLRIARATKKTEETWGIKKYERFYPVGIDAYIWFGYFIPQMKFLDKPYAENKIKELSSRSSEDFEWRMFMEGYLSGHRFYKDIYILMRAHYIKALENKVLQERIDQKLVQHMTIGYLHGLELLQKNNSDGQDSLFWKMLNEAKSLGKLDRWQEAASFFWSITRRTIKKENKLDDPEQDVTKEEQKKILDFWKWTYDNQVYVKNELGNKYSSFLARLSELTLLLDRIDDTTEQWLLLSAPYVDHHHNSTFFLEYLTKFEDEDSIKRIGKIYLKMLESTTPQYQSENILLIIERLYEIGKKHPEVKIQANDICNTYGRRGIHLLREIWSKNK